MENDKKPLVKRKLLFLVMAICVLIIGVVAVIALIRKQQQAAFEPVCDSNVSANFLQAKTAYGAADPNARTEQLATYKAAVTKFTAHTAYTQDPTCMYLYATHLIDLEQYDTAFFATSDLKILLNKGRKIEPSLETKTTDQLFAEIVAGKNRQLEMTE